MKNIFLAFAKNHEYLLEKMVKENENRLARLAIERRKIHYVHEEAANKIEGKK
jgi:hypothetical protein